MEIRENVRVVTIKCIFPFVIFRTNECRSVGRITRQCEKIPIKVILVDWERVHVTGLQFVF